MSSKFQTGLLIAIAIVVGMLYMRRPEKQIPIVQDIQVMQPEEKSITVSSEGEIVAKIDTIEFMLVIETEEKELADAKLKNEEAFLDAVALLSGHGVDEKDINTALIQTRVKTGYSVSSMKVVGYVVHRTVRVMLHHMEELTPLLTEIQETQDYEIVDIVLSVSDIDGYRDRALQLAIENADNKAKAIGREIDREIGEVISIQAVDSDYSNNNYNYFFSTLELFFGQGASQWQKILSVYEITIGADVTVKYELK